MPLCSMLTVVL